VVDLVLSGFLVAIWGVSMLYAIVDDEKLQNRVVVEDIFAGSALIIGRYIRYFGSK
jgi:hypothetical protein